jgi:hypothetical protein
MEISTGALDTFNFLPSGAALTYLLNQVNVVDGPVRLIVAPGDATVAATYSGFSNTRTPGPELTLANTSAMVPERGTLIFVISGVAILFGTRIFAAERPRREHVKFTGYARRNQRLRRNVHPSARTTDPISATPQKMTRGAKQTKRPEGCALC